MLVFPVISPPGPGYSSWPVISGGSPSLFMTLPTASPCAQTYFVVRSIGSRATSVTVTNRDYFLSEKVPLFLAAKAEQESGAFLL